MFFKELFCGTNSQTYSEALETYRQVPKEELQEYQFNKGRVRYEAGIKDSVMMPSLRMSFLKFNNNDPLDVVEAKHENMEKLMYEDMGKVVKKVFKSNYQQLVQKYKRSYQKYCDPDFKPCSESIGKTYNRRNIQWKRVTEIIPKAQFVSETISPQDILQGELGNCYFLSAIAALAQNDFRIKNIFPKLQINKNGFYMARLLHNGVLRQVFVDDFIPADNYNKPLFAKPSGGVQIWVMILQKCWAKLFGSYEAIIGGLPNQVLHAFSGAPTFYYSITCDIDQQQEVFQKLIEASNEGAIMCCGTKSDPQVQKMGLVLGHAYTLLDVYEQPYRMIKLRNPWGQRQWNGRAADNDKRFWQKINPFDKDRLGQKFQNDGTFFMLWEDFVQYFSMVDICKINDNAHYFYYEDLYKKDEPKVFEFQFGGGDVVISLSQPNIRGLDWRQKKKGYGAATMIIAKQVKSGSAVDYEYISSQTGSSFSNFHLDFKNIPKGKYLVYANILWTRSESDNATISVYTQSRVTLKESTVNAKDFMYKAYLSHARNNEENLQVMSQLPYEWACTDLLTDKCGYGYLAFHLDKNSRRKIGLELNQKQFSINKRQYTQIKCELLPPYKGKGKFKVTAQPGKELIIMFRMIPGNFAGEFSLPLPKMFNLY